MNNTLDIILKLVAILISSIAIFQLFEVRKKRHIDMFWKIYEQYTSDVQKKARVDSVVIRDIFNTKKHENLTRQELIEFYSSSYHLTEDRTKKELDKSVMNRIRFFNQIGLLLKNKMIDKDMLFELIGLGLEHDIETFEVILEAHRSDHKAPNMYSAFKITYDQYLNWKLKTDN